MSELNSRLWHLSILLSVIGAVPNAAFGTFGQGGPCPTGGDDCAPVPHNENHSLILWDIFPIGSWSIGRCVGWDECKCNNGAAKTAVGVAMVPKGTGSGRPVFICQDKDYYYWENGGDGFCGFEGMEHGSTGDTELGALIDFSILGTTPLTGTSIELTDEPAFYCPPPTPSPWRSEPTEAAEAFVHVYEVDLEATPQGTGANISWSITQFSGSVSGDVTPNHLMLKVTDGINEAVGGPYSGWSGSESWDGAWAGGGSWDGCGQVTISLEVAPEPWPERWGIPSIIITDEFCGVWEYFNQHPGKSIQFGCSGYSNSPTSSSDSGTVYGYCPCEGFGLLTGLYFVNSTYRECVDEIDCIQTDEQVADVYNVTCLGGNCSDEDLMFLAQNRFKVGGSPGGWTGMSGCSNSICNGPCKCSSIVQSFSPSEISAGVENEFDLGISFLQPLGTCVCAISTDPAVTIPAE